MSNVFIKSLFWCQGTHWLKHILCHIHLFSLAMPGFVARKLECCLCAFWQKSLVLLGMQSVPVGSDSQLRSMFTSSVFENFSFQVQQNWKDTSNDKFEDIGPLPQCPFPLFHQRGQEGGNRELHTHTQWDTCGISPVICCQAGEASIYLFPRRIGFELVN